MWTALVILLLAPAKVSWGHDAGEKWLAFSPWWWVVSLNWLQSRQKQSSSLQTVNEKNIDQH